MKTYTHSSRRGIYRFKKKNAIACTFFLKSTYTNKIMNYSICVWSPYGRILCNELHRGPIGIMARSKQVCTDSARGVICELLQQSLPYHNECKFISIAKVGRKEGWILHVYSMRMAFNCKWWTVFSERTQQWLFGCIECQMTIVN